ncbi:hypothetical protein E2H86_18195 [Pseudomonas putida]|uniref:hypothetical protein n=1 Tax=Pseudomonas putida group TaxID=136845 RepID=UPI0010592E22|nr:MULTISPECIES: hypothetical protein [Pseudomonas putida group]MBF8745835.1 hypothetical protein [Pseudomonas monteilii]TDJ75110.1 hypothetical protein E2H86_18195 [Pseudomonas putida]
MSNPASADLWYTRSFTGKLYVRKDATLIPTRQHAYGADPDRPTYEQAYSNDGWLRMGGSEPTVSLACSYLSKGPDGLRFTISGCDEDSERKLGVSRNGYLGFYKVAAVTDPWLIEPVTVDGDVLVCRLKDHRGHVVKAELGTSDQYLNVETGTSLEFAIVHAPD